MVDILHRVGIESPLDDVYTALTTIDGLANWWTTNTHGDENAGGVIRFRFGPEGKDGFDMKVTDLQPAEQVLWEVVGGPEEWMGTEVSFALKREGDYTIVLFQHRGWREPIEFMHHCSTKWAMFLMSLKSYLETGTGAPDPRDVLIDNWH
ncbi:SRPBCC family protein [Nocardia brasiliensis]|uniref:Activator of HSP90 ATPase 1 family protein n=1 Tax=Nocardia brasiliensis (strain ATCC 700358 / HUJEG-1) TaxID=1133849 RepID=K0EZ04_NOCB7|nr:SRPBCC domain-containing protein [Nocardia brasiliensis]AFU02130.1 activator of HSP90 ATPase 1 family protein [Nocardia brasiliensis ATCC 700358]OCF87663.1 polyketide cyclase [Nocardia brasiliensis]